MAEQQTPEKGSSVKLWVRMLLLVSLGLNVAIAGIALGAFYRFGAPSSDKRPPRGDEIAGTYTRALNSEDRRAIARQMRRQQRDVLPTRAEFRAQFQDVVAALRSEDFDAEVLADLFAQQRAFGMKRAELGHDLLLERLTLMSAEERAGFADRLEENLSKKMKPGRDGGHPRPGPGGRPPKSDNRP